ncbi:pyridoxal-phosphate dependent enzyme [Bizionia gelidisalsuginis]|uniref:Pyridoxal-phosphate dependent enzyme n=1 Tax=Bizionia gelidisalsuginis TaxID=291188 RepID=A0ABY3MBC1_9FLAO|nr:pyridoxal-phosphate dependent enzyme [Bizionia gelidisalsuginis]TYC14098.1 pyridoxal-phosphate dependent enzyme [Bizionia gelidisalsuginis]
MIAKDFITIQKGLASYIHCTPVITSSLLNKIIGVNLQFKCENFQKTGSFKFRGATYAIQQLTAAQKSRGVVTHSSGNFAQALALAAKGLGVKAHIVMPKNAPQVKKDAVLEYDGFITECEPGNTAREKSAAKIENEIGATFIHPSNNKNVILGHSTATLELLDQTHHLDIIVAPVGGGGLLAGTALAAHHFSSSSVIGAEPMQVDDAYRSLLSGKIEMNVHNNNNNTIADGLRTHLGSINFPIIQKYVDGIIRVEESEIISAMRLVFQYLKIVIEPSSAVALAAVIKEKEPFKSQNVGIILSGGNVNLDTLSFS